VVDKVALGRVFSEYFVFPRQSSFHRIFHHHNHPGQATIGRRAEWTQLDSTPPLSEAKQEFTRQQAEPVLAFECNYVLPKCRLTFLGLHGVISQSKKLFIVSSVRTSNPLVAYLLLLSPYSPSFQYFHYLFLAYFHNAEK
jgi:hypothetical protein